MRKLLLVVILLFLVAVPLLAANNRSKFSSWKKFKAHLKGNLPPNIRKCLNVKCGPGTSCFYGRCVAIDTACATIKCGFNSRCVNGKCIPKKHNPKKMICPPVGFSLKKEKCNWALKKQCRAARIVKDVCGFNPRTREYHDYKSPCDACTDRKCDIKFFFPIPCAGAPRICERDEECMNGVCTDIFKDKAFKDKEGCNRNADCKPNEQCAAHLCIDKRDLYDYLDSISEIKDIVLRTAA